MDVNKLYRLLLKQYNEAVFAQFEANLTCALFSDPALKSVAAWA